MPPSRVAVLVNPGAGRGRHRAVVDAALDRLRDAGRVWLLDAGSAEQAQQSCRRAVEDGAWALVAVGGDGTMHLALQAVAGSGVPFGLIPAGTGNDFAASVGLPADPSRAADTVVAALSAGRTHPVDLALLSTSHGVRRWFGAVLAAGFDAIVNERGNRLRWPRGPRRYDLAILAELIRLRSRDYTLTIDGRRRELSAVLLAVANTEAYGGGMRICPGADPHDGLLDLLWCDPIPRRTLVRIQPQVYAGTHVHHPAVHLLRAREITIEAEGIMGYADGERVAALPVTVTAMSGALRLLA